MTARVQALVTVWSSFWQAVEARGQRADQPGILNVRLSEIDESLRDALNEAYSQGYLSAVKEAVDPRERMN